MNATEHSETRPTGPAILVVDDEPDILELVGLLLEAEGYIVHRAQGGEEALALLDAIPPPELILLDYMMPRVTGLDVLEALRARPSLAPVPVVFVTASPQVINPNLPGVQIVDKPKGFERLPRVAREICGAARTA